MQHPDPGLLELLLRQLAWNLVNHASTVLVSLTAIAVVGLGPVGRGIGTWLRNRGAPPQDQLTDGTKAALGEIAERLDFMERALVALKPGAPPALPRSPASEEPATTPVS